MPYKRQGNKILHRKGGKWKVKQVCGSEAAAKAALRLLYGLESGKWKPTGKKSKFRKK